MNKVILPPATIGIIGGGQLGRMMALSARNMGYKIAVLEPAPNGPLAQVADIEINGAYEDPAALRKLLAVSDVVTYEFENISSEVVLELGREGFIPQGHRPVAITQNRLLEKAAIEEAGFRVAAFAEVASKEQLLEAVETVGYPAILKTATGGYDGKGQWLLRKPEDLEKAAAASEGHLCVLEGFVDFNLEISVIVTRSTAGEVQTFGAIENQHRNSILFVSQAPANISAELAHKAEDIAKSLMEKLDFVGTLAIEMFVVGSDIVINELAPRPHNSGHLTMDGYNVSQFEQHIRAICGLPLVKPELIKPSIMVNLLGQQVEDAIEKWQSPEFSWGKLHLYGKDEMKHNRKVGHLNFALEDRERLQDTVEKFLRGFPV